MKKYFFGGTGIEYLALEIDLRCKQVDMFNINSLIHPLSEIDSTKKHVEVRDALLANPTIECLNELAKKGVTSGWDECDKHFIMNFLND